MVNFIKENLLGSVKEFRNRFINPIQNGQCADSTLHDVRIMKKRAHILYEMLAGCVKVINTQMAKTTSVAFVVLLFAWLTDWFLLLRGKIIQRSPSSCLPSTNMCCRWESLQSSANSTDTTWSTSQVRTRLTCLVKTSQNFSGVWSSRASRGCQQGFNGVRSDCPDRDLA